MQSRRQPFRPVFRRHLAVVLAVAGLVAQLDVTSLQAQGPERFLVVTNWYATFTRTLQSSGAYTDTVGCVYNWSFSHASGISSQLKTLVLPLPGLDPEWSDVGRTNISLNLSIQDTSSQTCNAATDTVAASSGTAMNVLQWSSVRISLAATNYTLEPGYLVGPYNATVNGDPFPPSVLMWFPPVTNPIVEPLPTTGMVLQGSRRYALNQLTFKGVMNWWASFCATVPRARA